jgi:hypothetical protein
MNGEKVGREELLQKKECAMIRDMLMWIRN